MTQGQTPRRAVAVEEPASPGTAVVPVLPGEALVREYHSRFCFCLAPCSVLAGTAVSPSRHCCHHRRVGWRLRHPACEGMSHRPKLLLGCNLRPHSGWGPTRLFHSSSSCRSDFGKGSLAVSGPSPLLGPVARCSDAPKAYSVVAVGWVQFEAVVDLEAAAIA